MDLETCLKKFEYVGTLSVATTDENGAPQIRCVSAVHYEKDAIYFLTARGKAFCKQLLRDGRVQILAHTKYNEMLRLSATAHPAENSREMVDVIFDEQPYLANVYPGKTREICTIFCIEDAEVEYFNLGVRPIFREVYAMGKAEAHGGVYEITSKCIGCGKCQKVCPQACIESGSPFKIQQTHCLHCGACHEACPAKAITAYGE